MANERLVKKMSSSSDGSRTTATWSFWVRRITLTSSPCYLIEHKNLESSGVTNRWAIRFMEDHLYIIANSGYWVVSNQLFRDCTDWYHFVIAVNTNASGINNKFKIWVNGSQLDLTGMATQANTSGSAGFGKGNEEIAIGYSLVDSVGPESMNMTQFTYVNNQQMQATDFGSYDSNGRWKPKSNTAIRTAVNSGGGFGVNGFLLPLTNEYDQSGEVANSSCAYHDQACPNVYRAMWDSTSITGNERKYYARVQPSPWKKYSGASLYSPGTFGEGSAGDGLNRWTSKNGLFQGNSTGIETLSNATSWTIEAWVKQTRLSTNAQGGGVWLGINAAAGNNLVLLRSKNGNNNGWDAWIGGSTNDYITSGTHSIWNYDWQHQAVVWDGTKFKYYSDGKYIGEFTAGNVINSGSYLTLFNELDASAPSLGMDNHCCGMHMDSLRITSGQALYTTSTTTAGDTVFTPGDITSKTTFTTDGDSSTSSITGTVTHLLSLPANHVAEIVRDQATVSGSGADSTWNPHWIRTGTNQYPNLSGDAKFGRASINFVNQIGNSDATQYKAALIEDRTGDSGGSALNTTNNQFYNVFNGDFTLEFWYKVHAVAGRGNYYPRVFDLGGGNTENQFQIILAVSSNDIAAYGTPAGVPWLFDNTGNYDWNYSGIDTGPTYTTPNGGNSVINDDTWHHYAVTRSGNVFRQFFDGNLYLQRTTSTANYQPVAFRPAMIGGVSDVAAHTSNNGFDIVEARFQGAINQFRIVADQALYTSNFTPGNLNSKTTFSTDGTSQGNSITGSVRTLLAPDIHTTGTDVSTSDTQSTNGFDDFGFDTGERTIKDNPLNVFCTFTDNDATNPRKNATVTYKRVKGLSGSAKEGFTGSMSVSGGKWYFEIMQNAGNTGDWMNTGGGMAIGWRATETKGDGTEDLGQDSPWAGYSTSFGIRTGQSGSSTDRLLINGNQTFTTASGKGSDDVAKTMALLNPSNGNNFGNTHGVVAVGIACDLDNGIITMFVNGEQTFTRTDSSIGRGTPSTRWAPAILLETGTSSQDTFQFNFGDTSALTGRSGHSDDNGYGSFITKPPTGYLALCSENIKTSHNTITDGSQHMQCVTYTGTGSSQNIQTNFKPALLMIKHRNSNTTNQFWFDRLRGTSNATYGTVRPTTIGPATSSANYMTDFLSTADGDSINGFTVNSNETNMNNGLNVAWCWRADDSFTPTGSSISNATGLRNTTAGFSMMKWDGASGGGNITHGLNRAPDFVISKNVAQNNNWDIYHISVEGPQKAANALCDGLIFTNATQRGNSVRVPSSTHLNLVDGYTNGDNKVMVAYCWHAVAGYSAFGRYTCATSENQDGFSSPDVNGPFIYCGFKPAFVMMKRVDAANDWGIRDNARNTENPRTRVLRWNTQGTAGDAGYLEEQDQGAYGVNFTSEGFQIVSGAGETMANNGEYIYAAWAEKPAWAANAVV